MSRTLFYLALLLLFCDHLAAPAQAAETLFNSSAAIKGELSRLSGEGRLFVTAPVDPYLPETFAVAPAAIDGVPSLAFSGTF